MNKASRPIGMGFHLVTSRHLVNKSNSIEQVMESHQLKIKLYDQYPARLESGNEESGGSVEV